MYNKCVVAHTVRASLSTLQNSSSTTVHECRAKHVKRSNRDAPRRACALLESPGLAITWILNRKSHHRSFSRRRKTDWGGGGVPRIHPSTKARIRTRICSTTWRGCSALLPFAASLYSLSSSLFSESSSTSSSSRSNCESNHAPLIATCASNFSATSAYKSARSVI